MRRVYSGETDRRHNNNRMRLLHCLSDDETNGRASKSIAENDIYMLQVALGTRSDHFCTLATYRENMATLDCIYFPDSLDD